MSSEPDDSPEDYQEDVLEDGAYELVSDDEDEQAGTSYFFQNHIQASYLTFRPQKQKMRSLEISI